MIVRNIFLSSNVATRRCNRLARWESFTVSRGRGCDSRARARARACVCACVPCTVTELQFFSRERSVSDRGNCVIAQLRDREEASPRGEKFHLSRFFAPLRTLKRGSARAIGETAEARLDRGRIALTIEHDAEWRARSAT